METQAIDMSCVMRKDLEQRQLQLCIQLRLWARQAYPQPKLAEEPTSLALPVVPGLQQLALRL